MNKLSTFARVAGAASLIAALASACGGQSFEPGGNDGGKAGMGQGGSVGTAGTHTTGGKAHAGSGGKASGGNSTGATGGAYTAGTESGGAATAGSGGSSGDDACDGPATMGEIACDAYIPAWTHDATTGLCRPIIYGGCGGTKNLYKSFQDCQQACPGGTPNYDACKLPTDCALVGQGCCGVCDGPGITAHDFLAYNKQYAAEVVPCANVDIACGACPPVDGGQGTMKYFVPNCVQGQCAVEDLRTSPVSACKTADDCRLRNGNGCCSACNVDQPIAVSKNESFENLVCGNLRPPCAACPPPPDAVAVCDQTGHCQVAYAVAVDPAP